MESGNVCVYRPICFWPSVSRKLPVQNYALGLNKTRFRALIVFSNMHNLIKKLLITAIKQLNPIILKIPCFYVMKQHLCLLYVDEAFQTNILAKEVNNVCSDRRTDANRKSEVLSSVPPQGNAACVSLFSKMRERNSFWISRHIMECLCLNKLTKQLLIVCELCKIVG